VATLTVTPIARPEEEIDVALKPSAEMPEAPAAGGPDQKSQQIANALVLALMFAAPALVCLRAACANDPDVWWHLRTGEWILQHHAVPRVDPFSGPNAGKPWPAYSWLFELLFFKIFQRFNLIGIVGYSAGMVLAITIAVRHLIQRLQADFSVVILLVFATCASLGHLYTPRPWMFTILFFVMELDILMYARKTGRIRELLWLPVIFALWSNLHIQFIDGLLVLGLALAESIVTRWGIGEKTHLRAPWMAAALAGTLAATLANPFGWHIYQVAYDLASQPGVLDKINELKSIPFRDITDFSVLFLALASAAALAWNRRFLLFEIGLLIFAAVLSFRSQRDVWVMATAAAAILASSIVGGRKTTVRLPKFASVLAAVAAAILVLAGFRVMHVNNDLLETQITKTMPVRAVNTIRANGYAGPIYNDFNWGGYLIWALRMPVSIDGRAAFYGDAAIDRSIATWNAKPDWESDPELKAANLVIGPDKAPLTQLLRVDSRYKLVYEDKVAAVFVTRK
jgi:hypothetical protein